MSVSSNSRIVKNTTFLYVRMLLLMGVTLYTSRVVLDVLGVDDFGIYQVVGGVVAMFGFLNNSMSLTTQRFLNFEMGKNDKIRVNRFFCLSISVHFLLALLVLILAETVGLWFLESKLDIPIDRMDAAKWVFHFSVFSAMVTIMQVPYNASIIANEQMNVYAYLSLIEVFLKLVVVFLIKLFDVDSLKLYAVLIFVVTVFVAAIYRLYCSIKFDTCKFRLFWDRMMFIDLFSQSSWNLLGTSANMMTTQGKKFLLNVFFGVALNASEGIASQVNAAINQFMINFLTAIRPQIVKLYAQNKMKELNELVYKGSLYSYYLIYLLTLPVLIQTETILSIWLKNVPTYSVLFTQLVLIIGLINATSVAYATAFQASGEVKIYQIIVSSTLFLTIPIAYICLKLGYPPYSIFIVSMVITLIQQIIRIFLLKKITGISEKGFYIKVLRPILIVTFVSLLLISPFKLIVLNNTFLKFMLTTICSFLIVICSIYYWGINSMERHFINKKLYSLQNKLKR